MSRKAKGIFKEKVFKLIEKMDIDEKLDVYNDLKTLLHKELLNEAKLFEERQNDLLEKAESLKVK